MAAEAIVASGQHFARMLLLGALAAGIAACSDGAPNSGEDTLPADVVIAELAARADLREVESEVLAGDNGQPPKIFLTGINPLGARVAVASGDDGRLKSFRSRAPSLDPRCTVEFFDIDRALSGTDVQAVADALAAVRPRPLFQTLEPSLANLLKGNPDDRTTTIPACHAQTLSLQLRDAVGQDFLVEVSASGTSDSAGGVNFSTILRQNFAPGAVHLINCTLTSDTGEQSPSLAQCGAFEVISVGTPAPTASPTPAPTVQPTADPAPTTTATPTALPTASPAPTAQPTASPAPTATASPTALPTVSPAPTAQPTASPAPTATASPTALPTASPAPTAQPTASPAPTATAGPTALPTASPAATATPTAPPTATPTAAPTSTPTATAAPTPSPSPTPQPTPAPAVASVKITQTRLLFTAQGQSQVLEAVARDASGAVLDVPLSWVSSDAGHIGVDADGRATALANNGSSQITAIAGGVASAPLLGVIAEPAAGVVTKSDAEILQGAIPTDPSAEPDLSNTYTVILAGPTPPDIGDILLGTGQKTLVGRVVAWETTGDDVLVTLEMVTLPEVFPVLIINELVDLSAMEVVLAPGIESEFEVTRNGRALTFAERDAVAKASGNGAFTKNCKSESSGFDPKNLPFEVSKPPTITIDVPATLELPTSASGDLEGVILHAEPVFSAEVEVKYKQEFEGKVTCTREVASIPVNVAGPFVVTIPLTIGFEASGKITLIDAKLGAKASATYGLVGGVRCNAVDCDLESDFGVADSGAELDLDLPGLGDVRVEINIAPSFTAGLKFGVGVSLLSYDFDVIDNTATLKAAGNFAPKIAQINDPSYQSDYKLTGELTAKPAKNIQKALDFFGLKEVVNEALSTSTELAKTPSGSAKADTYEYELGQMVSVDVSLDPADLNFLGIYNIDEVLLVEKNSSGSANVVARANPATTLDTEFSLSFTATRSGRVDRDLHVFLVTTLLPLEVAALEIAAPTPPAPPKIGLMRVRIDSSGGATTRQIEVATAEDSLFVNDSGDFADVDTDDLSAVALQGSSFSAPSSAGLALSSLDNASASCSFDESTGVARCSISGTFRSNTSTPSNPDGLRNRASAYQETSISVFYSTNFPYAATGDLNLSYQLADDDGGGFDADADVDLVARGLFIDGTQRFSASSNNGDSLSGGFSLSGTGEAAPPEDRYVEILSVSIDSDSAARQGERMASSTVDFSLNFTATPTGDAIPGISPDL